MATSRFFQVRKLFLSQLLEVVFRTAVEDHLAGVGNSGLHLLVLTEFLDNRCQIAMGFGVFLVFRRVGQDLRITDQPRDLFVFRFQMFKPFKHFKPPPVAVLRHSPGPALRRGREWRFPAERRQVASS